MSRCHTRVRWAPSCAGWPCSTWALPRACSSSRGTWFSFARYRWVPGTARMSRSPAAFSQARNTCLSAARTWLAATMSALPAPLPGRPGEGRWCGAGGHSLEDWVDCSRDAVHRRHDLARGRALQVSSLARLAAAGPTAADPGPGAALARDPAAARRDRLDPTGCGCRDTCHLPG